MSVSWDREGQIIDPDDVLRAEITLSVSADIEGITSFSFDLTIVGAE
jgi:hypothetical protein